MKYYSEESVVERIVELLDIIEENHDVDLWDRECYSSFEEFVRDVISDLPYKEM